MHNAVSEHLHRRPQAEGCSQQDYVRAPRQQPQRTMLSQASILSSGLVNAGANAFRRGNTNDPRTLAIQIILSQTLYYLVFIACSVFLQILFGFRYDTFAIFKYYYIVKTSFGILLILSNLVASIASAFIFYKTIGRSKLCLDFSVTRQIIHIIPTWFVSGSFPFLFSWWIIQTISVIISTLLGERLCMKKELEPILLQHYPKNTSASESGSSDINSLSIGLKTSSSSPSTSLSNHQLSFNPNVRLNNTSINTSVLGNNNMPASAPFNTLSNSVTSNLIIPSMSISSSSASSSSKSANVYPNSYNNASSLNQGFSPTS